MALSALCSLQLLLILGWGAGGRWIIPPADARDAAPCEKHPQIHRGSLDGASDGNNGSRQLHEVNPSEKISNQDLRHGTERLAGNVDCDDLVQSLAFIRLYSWKRLFAPRRTYSASKPGGRSVHVGDPALVSNCYPVY